MVQELCTGGELFDLIIERGYITESYARKIFEQIIKAVNYMHDNKICHRDIEPENFIFLTKV